MIVHRVEEDAPDPQQLLEESQVQWRRDFDAVALGFVLGVLSTLAAQGLW